MQQLTPNVYTETKIRGCDPSIVLTDEGAVFIDTAQWISSLTEMIAFAKEKAGSIKYLINTESHIDHIFGNHWLKKEGARIIGHEKINETFFKIPPSFNMTTHDYNVDIIRRQDAGALSLMPSEKDYIVARPDITFTDKLTFKLGGHTFHCVYTPGHSDANISVYVPEERVVFVGDTLFNDCQIWLHSAVLDDLFESLDWLNGLDVDYIVPGHGPVKGKEAIIENRKFLYDWLAAVADGMSKGWDEEECVKRISFAQRCPVDIGQSECMEYIQTNNVRVCYKYLSRKVI